MRLNSNYGQSLTQLAVEDGFEWFSRMILVAVLLLTIVISFATGCAMGWMAARFRSAKSEVEVRVLASVETQSQVTYRRELQTPRFQSLPEALQGAWPRPGWW